MSLFRKCTRLSPETREAIRLAAGSQHEIARQFEVSQALVWRIKNERNGNGKPLQQSGAAA